MIRREEFEAKVRARKELDLSLKDYSAAVELRPDLPEAYFGQGNVLYEKGLFKEAIAAFTKALPFQEKKAETFYRRAVAYENLDDDAHALEDLAACLREDPAYADAYLERGVLYFSQDRYDEALREFDKAIAIDPSDARYYSNKAMAIAMPAFDTGDEEELCKALACLGEAISLEPEYAEAYYSRGLVYGVLGETELETADFSKTIALEPDFALAYRHRYDCFCDLGKKEEAMRDWVEYCARSKKAARYGLPRGERRFYSAN